MKIIPASVIASLAFITFMPIESQARPSVGQEKKNQDEFQGKDKVENKTVSTNDSYSSYLITTIGGLDDGLIEPSASQEPPPTEFVKSTEFGSQTMDGTVTEAAAKSQKVPDANSTNMTPTANNETTSGITEYPVSREIRYQIPNGTVTEVTAKSEQVTEADLANETTSGITDPSVSRVIEKQTPKNGTLPEVTAKSEHVTDPDLTNMTKANYETTSGITDASVLVNQILPNGTVTEVTTTKSEQVTHADLTNNVTTELLMNTTTAMINDPVSDEVTYPSRIPPHATTNGGEAKTSELVDDIDLDTITAIDIIQFEGLRGISSKRPAYSTSTPSPDESLITTITSRTTATAGSGWSLWDWIPSWMGSYESSGSDPEVEPTEFDAGFVDAYETNETESSRILDDDLSGITNFENELVDSIIVDTLLRECEAVEGESRLSNCRGWTSRDITLCCQTYFQILTLEDTYATMTIVHDFNTTDAHHRNVTIGAKLKCIELSPTLWNKTDEFIIPVDVECDLHENDIVSITEEPRGSQCNLTHFSVTETPELVHSICLNFRLANYSGLDSRETCIIKINDDVMNRLILNEDGFYVETASDVDSTFMDILLYLNQSSDNTISPFKLTDTVTTHLSSMNNGTRNTSKEATTLPSPLPLGTDVTSLNGTNEPTMLPPQSRYGQLYLKEELEDFSLFSFFEPEEGAEMLSFWGVHSHRQVERVELEVMKLMGVNNGDDDADGPVMISICTL